MSEFITTIDVLGDNAVIDSIIQGTIAEFRDNRVEMVGANAFHSCKQLTTVSLPKATTIGDSAFYECSAMTNLYLPNVTVIASNAFRKCAQLEVIDLPRVTTIQASAFESCSGCKVFNIPLITFLATGAVPAGLETLDAPLLKSMSNHAIPAKTTAVILRNREAVCSIQANTFYSSTISSGGCFVYVPKIMSDGSDGVAAYQAATNWSQYADQIRAIEDYPEITGG